jgi:nucleoside-diphosphate-sugar epimerase
VITKFAVRLSKGLSPVIYGGGIHTRDFISLDSLALRLNDALKKEISRKKRTEHNQHD